MKQLKRTLCLVLLFAVLTVSVVAAGPVDTQKEASLALTYQLDDVPIEGALFHIYRLASVDVSGQFYLFGPFSDYPVSLKHNTIEGWNDLAYTLKGYVQADKVSPMYSLTTDADGNASLSGLATGLYLVIGEKRTIGEYTYTVPPTIVSLPGMELDSEEWSYDVTIFPKASADRNPDDEPTTISRKVLKVWDDKENESKRPQEIVVHLLCDGEEYDVVRLNANNNWRHEWKELPEFDSHRTRIEWTVVEEEVENYTVKVEQEGVTFVVTNTSPGIKPPTDPNNDLPKTGLLWWPVPMLLSCGILFLIIGIVRRRRFES